MATETPFSAALNQLKQGGSIPTEMASFFVQAMQHQIKLFTDKMAPRVRLSDNSLGYRARAEAEITFVLGNDPYKTNAPRETIKMIAKESEIYPRDPVLTADGNVRVDLEIRSFTMEGTSETLFGKRTQIKMSAGTAADKFARPSYGVLHVPLTQAFGAVPVRSVQEVFVTVETPLGILFNRQAARMVSHVQAIPPVGVPYTQEGVVPLVNESGAVVAAKVAQTTTLTQLIG